MFNLELYNLEFNQNLPENICNGATHVTHCASKLFMLKKGRIEYYDHLLGAEEEIHQNYEIPISSDQCITKFSHLLPIQKLWFGTGKQFVFICPSTCSVSFVINEENEFDVAEWNNSQDTLAIIRADGKLGTFAVDTFDLCLIPLNTADLNDENARNPLLNVGWGSESTQFDYSKVKKIGSKKSTEDSAHKDISEESEEQKNNDDDMKPRLCWKPDDGMFAVNYFTNGKRKLKVYSSICELIYIYEDIIGLQPIISWRPSSTFISTVVWTNKQYSFTLFGRSSSDKHVFGLQNEDKIEEIKWNPMGPEVAIQQRNFSEDVATINLYTFLNFKWYLKQCLRFTSLNPLVSFEFVTAAASNQCVLRVTTVREILIYYFKTVVHHSHNIASKDGLTVAVVDGQKLYLSHCKESVIPSPLYHLIITANKSINCVTFHPEKQMLAVLDSMNSLNIYNYSTDFFELVYKYNLPCLDKTYIPLRIQSIQWRSDKQIVCFKNESCSKKKLQHLYFLNMNGEPEKWNFISNSPLDENIHHVQILRNSSTIIMYSKLDNVASQFDDNIVVVHSSVGPYLDTVLVDSEIYVFKLTNTYSFMINNFTIYPLIKSFMVYNNYLIVISSEYQLIVVRLDSDSLKDLCELKFDNFYTKPIDNGSQLLFVLPNTSNVVMENRRGNFELYTCRIITIDRVESLIQNHKWLAALNILRLEKLDLNVIIDLNATRFLENVDTFIENVHSSNILNEFIVNLNDDNVFDTLYKDCTLKSYERLKNKCTLVCEAMIKSMQRYNYIHFITSISIAEIMKSEPSVIGSLEHISYLLSGSTIEQTYTAIAETTLLTIQNLKPNLELYKTALSMYNLELAVFIASVICMDPSEYQPMISALKKMDECAMRWTINNHLKKFHLALPYYLRLGSDESVYEYIIKHDLAAVALPLLKGNSQLYDKILPLVASKFFTVENFEAAAAIYLHSDLKMQALSQYVVGLSWRKAILLMQQLNVQQVEKSKYFSYIVEGLIKKGNSLEASFILDEYLHDYEEAIRILLQHKLFSKALEIAHKHSRRDIIENDIMFEIENYLKMLIQKFSKSENDFNKYKSRLMDLRKEKQNEYIKSLLPSNNIHEAFHDEYDEVRSQGESIISAKSISSSRTGFTVKSGSSRKTELKKEHLRIGGHFEDIALIKILYNLIDEIFKYGPEIHDIIVSSIAVRYGITFFMTEAHNKLLLLQKYINCAIKDIWPVEMNSVGRINGMDATLFMYKNICDLDVKYRVPPSKLDMNWALNNFFMLEKC